MRPPGFRGRGGRFGGGGGRFGGCYLLRSMTRPMDPTPDSLFHTACQKENHLVEWTRSAPTRGVVCLQSSTRFVLCNPIFPKGLGDRSHVSLLILQYSIVQGGVLYYLATDLSCLRFIVMCFNVNSETFDYNQLPEGVILCKDSTMVNYNGKVALENNKSETGKFEICVRNQVSGEWELQRVVITDWRANVGSDHMMFSFVGTIGTGELVFTAPDSLHDGSEYVLHYTTDPPQEKKKFKMFRVEAVNGGSYHYVRACLNHFDSRFPIN
ncbi:unnamed protein product [Eruca vesicaria subsp. sativa]|uniref:F-box associated beta-propeller type 3 domain-containing protein n=1 Tax=Eruca vesicaria subsp. sativa TaxID=29727 RepID=A0ABC8KFF3_ERUVS|nr:unnamed protein product [Eruca vesicaria subsp. sativa]